MKKEYIINVAPIQNKTVKPFIGYRSYVATGDLVDSEIISFENVTYESRPSRANMLVEENDLICARMQSTNKIYLFSSDSEKYILSTGFLVLKPTNDLYPKYLYYYLKSEYFQSEKDKNCKGATQKAINNSSFSKLQIPLPPLTEQKHIAKVLDTADALIKKNKVLLQEYNALQQAIFLDMFGDPVRNPKGWEVLKLSEIVEKVQIGPFGTQLHKSDYQFAGIPLINPTNIIDGKIDLENAVKISDEKYDSLPQYHLIKNDIVMARRGDLSKVSIIEDEKNKTFCGTGSLYIRLNKEVDPFFVMNVLSNEKTTKFLEAEARGVTMPNLNKSIINSIPIYNPPLDLQRKYSAVIKNIEQQKEKAKESLAYSEELFGALVGRYFGNGKDN